MIPLYIKRGRRYHAVQWHMPEVIDALPAGAHLIVVGDGGRSTRYNITPDRCWWLFASTGSACWTCCAGPATLGPAGLRCLRRSVEQWTPTGRSWAKKRFG
jgi:hypothetical protein